MAYLNENYLKLQAGYLFPEIARRVRQFSDENPEAAKRLIRCGIGDVTEQLPRAAIEAMKAAAEELDNVKRSVAMAQSRATNSSAAKSRSLIIAIAESKLLMMKFSCRMGRNAI